VAVSENTGKPESLILETMPNPFMEKSLMKYTVPADGHVNLALFNIYGQKAATLVDEFRHVGMYTLEFDATSLQKGWYSGRLTVGTQTTCIKMLKL